MPVRRAPVALVAAAVTFAAATGAALLVGSQLESPQQAAANAAPPIPSVLTVSVEKRPLTNDIVLRGEVVASAATPVRAATENGTLVTGLPLSVGDEVPEGGVVAVVNGRPIIALHGRLGAYRDLRPGDTGPDVEQLHAALRRLGFGVRGDRRGTFGPGTEAAVAALYRRSGFDAPMTSDELASVELSAAGQVAAASDAVEGARRNLRRASEPADERIQQRAARRLELLTEELRLTTRRSERALSAADAAIVKAERSLARARADQRPQLALAAAREGKMEAKRNRELVELAQTDMVENAKAALMFAEVDLAELPPTATSSDVLRAQQQVAAARRALQLAQVQADAARTNAHAAVTAATAAHAAALADLSHADLLTDLEVAVRDAQEAKSLAVEEAAAALASARAAVEEQLGELAPAAPPDLSELEMAVRAAERMLRESRVSAAAISGAEGVMLPQAEVAFVPAFPAKIAAVTAQHGARPPDGGVIAMIGSGSTSVRGVVGAADQGLLRAGMPADVVDEVTGRSWKATVNSVADKPDTSASSNGFAVELNPDVPVPLDAIGSSVRVTVTAASSPSDVLVVPSSAIVSDTSGRTRVDVADGDVLIPVEVTVGMAAAGFAEIRPEDSESVRAGDLVVIGRRAAR